MPNANLRREDKKMSSENKSLTEYKAELPEQFSEAQLAYIQAETPKAFVKMREGRGGGSFPYVEVGYVQLLLNTIFGSAGWDWEYELVKELSFPNTTQIVVNGKLTVRIHDKGTGEIRATIVKTASGGGEIKLYGANSKAPGKPIDLADDVKSASADALKKAASYLGIAADVYAPKVFAVVRQIRHKNKTQKPAVQIVDAEMEESITDIPEEGQADIKALRASLMRGIFAAADAIYKAKLDASWINKPDEEKKNTIKSALAANGLSIPSFSKASIEELRQALNMLNDGGKE